LASPRRRLPAFLVPLLVRHFADIISPVASALDAAMADAGAGNGHVTAPHRISANEFSYTITFSFQVGDDALHWAYRACRKATEAEDGLGLPGNHGCGDARVLQSASYVG